MRVFDRNAANKEKQVDVSLATTVMEDSYEHMKPARGDRVVLIAGDGDYSPTLESLASRGIPTSVVFWRHATARALINFADQFHALDSHLDFLAGHAGATLPILAAWASLPSCGRKSELPRGGSWWLDVVPNVFRKLQCST